ncbi:GNAT family N-acetyltransferase [Pseudomonas oligotrophica]|uniref:GNAT family N-acetyltransferase n=1 Tax=Pseudomonas oligotrophica TaxID=2912055 RepID=UPI001F3B1CD3|nr:GNAT family protein [Pseudomonas oligotrophica]MCF7203145.1 GNAT family N-acetyltransferase [Pseudomonas oligotrophica]
MFVPLPFALQRGALRLDPLAEADIPVLAALAEQNREELACMNGPLRPDWYRQALASQRDGRAVVFTLRMGERVVGTTRLADFLPELPAAELGWTWLDRAEHGTGLNASVKFLLLRHVFEDWQLVRLQLKTAASNLRSQRAIEKLGAQYEGRLRNHRRLADGRLDDTLLYSITDRDWPAIRERLGAGG